MSGLEFHKALPSTSSFSDSKKYLGEGHTSQPSAHSAVQGVETLQCFAQLWSKSAVQNTGHTYTHIKTINKKGGNNKIR